MNDTIYFADNENFDDIVNKSTTPVVVYFYSDDCLPCTNFSRIFDKAVEGLQDEIKFVKVYRPKNRKISDEMNVKITPTVMFFDGGKEVCTRLTGYIDFPEFKESIENTIKKACPIRKRSVVRSDVLILGAGPAGLTAAIYNARSRLQTVVIDQSVTGGQVASTFHIANYPGTNGEVRGIDLMENMKKQALDFGTQIDEMQQIVSMDFSGDEKHIKTEQNDYYARVIIIATGAEPRKLPVETERDFRGRGIHYCATCDGAFYTDANVAVVGGGISALEESAFLTKYAKSVKIINKNTSFKASQAYVDKILNNPEIEVFYNTNIEAVQGESFVNQYVLKNKDTNELTTEPIDGIFVYIGMQPNSSIFKGHIEQNEWGYIKTDEKLSTNIPGVFAAGDVREKEIRQIATAVGDGTIAAMMAERYLANRE